VANDYETECVHWYSCVTLVSYRSIFLRVVVSCSCGNDNALSVLT
jgi:hypothetical protein